MGKLWFGGPIYTMDQNAETVEAVYTDKGMIIETGTLSALRNKYGAEVEEIDLKGGTMIPGLVDSHMHLVSYGEYLMRIDLSQMKSREEVLEAVKNACDRQKSGEWIIAEGWNENEWAIPDLILRDDLDAITTSHPVMLKRICRHAMIVNSAALSSSEIREDQEELFGGVIERYPDGRINGLLKDQAQELITAKLPEITVEYVEKALRAAIKDCHKHGLVGGHTEDLYYHNGFVSTYEAYKNVIEKEGIRFKAHLLVHHEVVEDMASEGYRFGDGTEFIEFGAMKIFADGSLGGNTALLSEPYLDQPNTQGVAIFKQDELAELVKRARELGLPVAIHAIGDLGFEFSLNAIEAYPPPIGKRDRLIHAQIMRKELIERALAMPVIFDIQPMFVLSDFPWVTEKIGPHLLDCSYAWRTFLQAGIPCAGGSDAPVEVVNPLNGIYAAVTRAKPSNHTVYGENERLSMFEAISLFTGGSAYAILHEHNRGKIKSGYEADFSIFDRNLFEIEAKELLETRAVMTVINEEIVYSA